MPLEIRELHIKAVISPTEGAQNGQSGGGAQPGGKDSKTDKIVEICVEKVLEILNEKGER